MQGQARTAGSILYDSLNSAVDQVSGQLGKLLTGQKTSLPRCFRALRGMVKENTKSLMQKGLGKSVNCLVFTRPREARRVRRQPVPRHSGRPGAAASTSTPGNLPTLADSSRAAHRVSGDCSRACFHRAAPRAARDWTEAVSSSNRIHGRRRGCGPRKHLPGCRGRRRRANYPGNASTITSAQ